jgi:hypothetical protein
MRAIRALAVVALVALDVSAAAAQGTRGFKDSWFWGLKGGGMFYQVQSDQEGDGSLGVTGGIDWLITRTRGGLYASFDYLYFKDQFVFVNDSISPLDTVPRQVFLSGMRRFTLAGMVFPLQSHWIQPYAGAGIAFNHIAKAEPVGPFRNATQAQLVQATISEFRAAATPLLIVGTQIRLLHTSAFGQATASPAHDNFFLFTGNNWRVSFEGGLRYNFGSSIDKLR